MEFKTDYRAERYALDAKWDDFPAAVQEHAVMCGVDLMTALMNFSEQAQRAMQPNGAWIELDPYEMRILIEE